MCGITGITSVNIRNKDEIINKMVGAIVHRGPDDSGVYYDDNVAVGMRRLSIIDIAGGHQPIFSDDGNLVIVFNGEIYNYKELRSILIKQGHDFKTNSDTEVVLKLYQKEGEGALNKLRGMFAFCIYNKAKKTFFIARDYFGIKPLYYMNIGGSFAFASEVKSLLLHPDYKTEVNDSAFLKYLSFQYVPENETMFKNIFRLMPGSFMEIDVTTGGVKRNERFWRFEFNQTKKNPRGTLKDASRVSLGYEKLKKELLDSLKGSVESHLVSDVPVGAFLSGGVDSSAIVGLMKKVSGNDEINTFSIGFEGSSAEKNELIDAKKTAKYVGTNHTEIKLSSEDYFKKLPELIWYFDEPVGDPSAIALYFVAKEASKKVKVVLSGEGADELFGGYNIYLEPFALQWVNFIPKIVRKNILQPIVKSKFNFFGKNYIRRALLPLEERFIGNSYVFKPEDIKKIVKNLGVEPLSILRGSTPKLGYSEPKDVVKKYYDEIKDKGWSDSTKMQYIDIHTWLQGDILTKADKMTMANSLELRVPFLDVEVAKFASTIPDSLKFHGGKTKYLLREAVKGIIPEKSRTNKKLGFPVPVAEWLREGSPYGARIFDMIRNNGYLKEHLNFEEVGKLFASHLSGKRDNSRKIYILLVFALWHEIFVNNKEPRTLLT